MKNWIALFLAVLGICFVVGTHDPPMRRTHAQESGGPILLASGWNITTVTSGNAVFATNLVPHQAGSVLRIGVVLGSTAPLAIYETDGTTTFTSWLNGGTALTAGSLYTFVWEARSKTAIGGPVGSTAFNFKVGSGTTVPILRVTECTGGVE